MDESISTDFVGYDCLEQKANIVKFLARAVVRLTKLKWDKRQG